MKEEFFENEVRDGFYIPGIMKRAWGAQLVILSVIDAICKKHHIRYFLSAGTLLGAYRSGEFIPWDDDIDIIMLPEEFQKLLAVLPEELPPELHLLNTDNNKEICRFCSGIGFFQFQFQGDLLRKYCEFPYPTNIDVFALDEFSPDEEEEWERRKRFLQVYLGIVQFQEVGESADFLETLRKIELCQGVQFHYEEPLLPQLYQLLNRIRRENNGKGGEVVAYLPFQIADEHRVFPKSMFERSASLPFCGKEFPVPYEYEKILEIVYGDFRKKVKAGGEHEYPYFKEYAVSLEEYLRKHNGTLEFLLTKENLKRERVASFRENALEMAKELRKVLEKVYAVYREGEYELCLSLLLSCQESGIAVGNYIEKRKGNNAPAVHLLEQYCESVFQIHSLLEEALRRAGESGTGRTEIERKVDVLWNEVQMELDALYDEIDAHCKRTVVFLPERVKHFESMRPLIDVLLTKEEFAVKIIPIPFYEKTWDGTVMKEYYEGEDIPKQYPITDYQTYDFAVELPDAIVFQSPYDEYDAAWSVDPFFFSKNMQQFTSRLVYIPWFVTDEIDPKNSEDGKAFYNMRYYATMPGVFYADCTILQSEGMKEAYLAKISDYLQERTSFNEEEKASILGSLRKKISGAGSFLLEEKKELVLEKITACFLDLFSC